MRAAKGVSLVACFSGGRAAEHVCLGLGQPVTPAPGLHRALEAERELRACHEEARDAILVHGLGHVLGVQVERRVDGVGLQTTSEDHRRCRRVVDSCVSEEIQPGPVG
jgi:hypothetical protein